MVHGQIWLYGYLFMIKICQFLFTSSFKQHVICIGSFINLVTNVYSIDIFGSTFHSFFIYFFKKAKLFQTYSYPITFQIIFFWAHLNFLYHFIVHSGEDMVMKHESFYHDKVSKTGKSKFEIMKYFTAFEWLTMVWQSRAVFTCSNWLYWLVGGYIF